LCRLCGLRPAAKAAHGPAVFRSPPQASRKPLRYLPADCPGFPGKTGGRQGGGDYFITLRAGRRFEGLLFCLCFLFAV